MAKLEVAIHDQTNILPKGRLIVVFSALASALLITFIDQQSIGVVLPTIGRELNASSTITWAGTSSLIANTAFQVLYGRLSDIFGRKAILVSCLVLLGLGDLLCSVAQTGPQFYASRGIAGAASGGIIALVMMVVSDVTTLEQRGRYQGILGAFVGLGNAIGPFVSSGFAERATWRALFYLLCPLAVGAGVVLHFLLPPQSIPPGPLRTKLGKIDYWGIFFSSTGTILLLIPVSGIGTEFEASSPMVIAMLTLGSVLLLLFGVNEWKWAKLPMFPLRLLGTPALAAMMTQNFTIGIAYYGLLYYLPLFYQIVRQMSVTQSALLILPVVLSQTIASVISGQYISRMRRYGEVIWAGFTAWTVAAAVECTFSRTFPLAGMVVTLVLQGLGIGFIFQPTLVAAQAHSPKADRAVVISARNFIRSLGGAAGLAAASAIFSGSLVGSLPSPPTIPQAVADAVEASVFSVPDTSALTESQEAMVIDAYVEASRSVFYLWAGAIGLNLLLNVFVEDKGLQRREEKQAGAAPVLDERPAPVPSDEVMATGHPKTVVSEVVLSKT